MLSCLDFLVLKTFSFGTWVVALGDESGTFGAKMAKAKVAEAYMSKASEVREITSARMRVDNTE
jgi:hypothetical protein